MTAEPCSTCNGKGVLGGCGRDDCDHTHTLMFCNDCTLVQDVIDALEEENSDDR